MSGAFDVILVGADHVVPFGDVTSFTWFEVVPLKLVPPLPQFPAPSLSAQTIAIRPFDRSIDIDG